MGAIYSSLDNNLFVLNLFNNKNQLDNERKKNVNKGITKIDNFKG